jgi:hypothetical protein
MASLTSGTLAIDSNGNVSGSGWARNRYNAEVGTPAVLEALAAFVIPTVGQTIPPYSSARPATADDRTRVINAKVKFLKSIVDRIFDTTLADVAYLNANL